jgi:hypothetical protein
MKQLALARQIQDGLPMMVKISPRGRPLKRSESSARDLDPFRAVKRDSKPVSDRRLASSVDDV